MIILLNNIKRILRRKSNLIFMIIMPVVLISFISAFGDGSSMIRCGVVDYDNTELTHRLIESLEGKAVIKIIKEEEIQHKILGQYIEMALIIDEGFTKGIIENKDVRIRSVHLQETDASVPVTTSVGSFVNGAMNIADAALGDEEKFYRGLDAFVNGSVKVQTAAVENEAGKLGTNKAQMGFLVMAMLFLASIASMIMLEDKEKKVYYRVLAAPVKASRYMAENILSFFAVLIMQIVGIFIFLKFIMKVEFGTVFSGMITLSIVFALMCIALGVAINTVSKDQRQAGVIISLLLSPMCMLGGCWWPQEFMPKTLITVGQFVPTTWIMKAYDKLLRGQGIGATLTEILVIAGFTLVFFLFASWKKVDIAK